DLVFFLRKKGFDFAVAVSALGEGQVGGVAAAAGRERLDFHGGPHSSPAEATWAVGGSASSGGSGIAAGTPFPSLRRAQTQAICGFPAWRLSAGRYPGGAPRARRRLQTVHRPRC